MRGYFLHHRTKIRNHKFLDPCLFKRSSNRVLQRRNRGAPAFALISDHETWVEANFRETQVTPMRAGQEATISIDTYPGRVFKAHVTSMSPGAGSAGDHLQHSLRFADVR